VTRAEKPFEAGTVVELNRAAIDPPGGYLNGFYKRARVQWDKSGVRRWVLFSTLAPYTGPDRMIPRPDGRIGTHYAGKRL
jgi:hypothetical protein